MNGEKYMHLRMLPPTTTVAKIADANGEVTNHNVTLENVHVLKKGKTSVMIGVKGGYFMAAVTIEKPNAAAGAGGQVGLDALAIGFYWATGADQ